MNLGTPGRDVNESGRVFPKPGPVAERSAEASVRPLSFSIPSAAVLGLEAKRRRVDEDGTRGDVDEDYLEGEDEVPAEDLAEFVDRMSCLKIERGSASWRMLWKEHAELRLQHFNPEAYHEYLRRQEARERPERKEERNGEAAVDGEAEDDGYFIDLEDGGEEARVMRMQKPVALPTATEVRQHNLSHCNYRSWCPICVAGAADDRRHELRAPDGSTCPEVGSDYGFLRNRRLDKASRPMLVSKYRGVGPFAAHMVPRKGVGGGWIVQQYLRDLRKWGLRHKVLLRTDGEPAIVDLLNRVSDLRTAETLMEGSPVTDSRADSLAERAIQSVEIQIRVLKLALEQNLGSAVPVSHPPFFGC